MELYLLNTFAAVARSGSIRGAAKLLHMTAPTASGHIKTLEEELQIRLFRRAPRGMVLTAEGQALLARAEETLLAAKKLQDQASELREDISGTLCIGLNAPSGLLKASELAVQVKKSPGIGITFEPSSTGKILEGLSSGVFDAGFIFGAPRSEDIEMIRLGTFRLCIAIPKAFTHRGAPADWETLARLPWVCSDGYCPFQDIAADLFESRGLTIENTVVTNDEMTKLDFVRQGLGAALLLEEECRRDAGEGKLSLWETGPIHAELGFAYPQNRREEPLLQMLTRAVHNVWKAF